jgi:hypothetical protein
LTPKIRVALFAFVRVVRDSWTLRVCEQADEERELLGSLISRAGYATSERNVDDAVLSTAGKLCV